MLKALDKIIHFFMRSELTVVLWIATIVVVFCVLVLGAEARADDTQFYNHVRQGQCADEADLLTRAELLLFSPVERQIFDLCERANLPNLPLCVVVNAWYDETFSKHLNKCASEMEI